MSVACLRTGETRDMDDEILGIQSELAEEQQAAINRTNVKKLLGIA